MQHQTLLKCFIKYFCKDQTGSYYQFVLTQQDYSHYLKNLLEFLFQTNSNSLFHLNSNRKCVNLQQPHCGHLNHFIMSDKTIDYNYFDKDSFNFEIANPNVHCYIHSFDHYNSLSCTLINPHQIIIVECSFRSLHFHKYFGYLIVAHFINQHYKISFGIDYLLFSNCQNCLLSIDWYRLCFFHSLIINFLNVDYFYKSNFSLDSSSRIFL